MPVPPAIPLLALPLLHSFPSCLWANYFFFVSEEEYRYKHQQRCIQSSQRQKLSKQKSCTACASSKLSCDLGTPSCSRCINRNKTCRYVSANNTNVTSQQIEASQRPRGHHARTNSGQPYDNNSLIGDSSSLPSYSTRRQSDFELEAVMQDAGDPSRTSTTSNGLPLAALQQQPLAVPASHGINING